MSFGTKARARGHKARVLDMLQFVMQSFGYPGYLLVQSEFDYKISVE